MKIRKIGFTVSEGDFQMWEQISENLIEKMVFKNRNEIFETLVLYLQRARYQEIKNFKLTASPV